MNEHYSEDGNIKNKIEKTSNITYLKSHYHYDGQFYYMDADKDKKQDSSSFDDLRVRQEETSGRRRQLNNDNPFMINTQVAKQQPVLQSGYFGENPNLLSFGSRRGVDQYEESVA